MSLQIWGEVHLMMRDKEKCMYLYETKNIGVHVYDMYEAFVPARSPGCVLMCVRTCVDIICCTVCSFPIGKCQVTLIKTAAREVKG